MKRIEEIDILRGMAMLMVVVGHTQCPQIVHDLFVYVHIPLFFMLSGCTNRPDNYYYRSSNIKEFVLKRIKTLYLPFLLFALFITLLHNVFFTMGIYENEYTFNDYLYQILRVVLFSVGRNEPMLIPLWFMKSLFLCEISYALFIFVSHKCNINKWIIILPIISFALLTKGWSLLHVLDSNLLWPLAAIVFYILGEALLPIINTLIKYDKLIIWPFALMWLVSAYYYPSFFQIAYGFYAIIQLVLSIGAFISAWIIIQRIKKVTILNSVLTYVGKNTIPIYFLHIMCFYLISVMASVLIYPDSYSLIKIDKFIPQINWIIYVVISTILSLIIHHLYIRLKFFSKTKVI